MKCSVGNIVVLKSGETICITNYDEEAQKYKGFNTNDPDPQKEVEFSKNECCDEDLISTIFQMQGKGRLLHIAKDFNKVCGCFYHYQL